MSMIAKNNGNTEVDKLPGGTYIGISSAIIDLGMQENKQYEKVQRRFMLIWDIVGETVEINGEVLPRTIGKEYSFSLHEKSRLRLDLQAWRGKAFTEEELQGFNVLNILNKPCQLQIILEEKNGKIFNNIAAIISLAKGQEVQNLNQTYHFDIEDKSTWNNWEKISNWIKEKIKLAKNYEESGLKAYVEQQTNTNNGTEIIAPDDDLPF